MVQTIFNTLLTDENTEIELSTHASTFHYVKLHIDKDIIKGSGLKQGIYYEA